MVVRTIKAVAMLCALAALAFALTSCGGGDSDDGESVEDAAQGYADALESEDWAKACSYFEDEEVEERMGGEEQCEKSMKATTTPGALEGFEVTGTHPAEEEEEEGEEEETEGVTIVEFTVDGEPPNEFAFKQDEEGEWKFFED
jgi:hypothetical protein